MKIVLLWDNEIPSDIIVDGMIEESKKAAVNCEISAVSIKEPLDNHLDADVFLLSPLVCYEQMKIERLVQCPVEIIGIGAYASFDAKHVLTRAFDSVRDKQVYM